MDLSSKDFSLNFRGFEHDDPETVKRFTAFCRANFALSPQTFEANGPHSDTVVLAHGESHEELEALAKVLREIGARVDVSNIHDLVDGGAVAAPSTQELHRLFGHHQEERSIEGGPACPYPPLGRTLYVLTQSEGVFDRKRFRQKGTRIVAAQPRDYSQVREGFPVLMWSIVSLTIGFVALAAAALLLKRYPEPSDSRVERNFSQSRPLNALTDGEGTEERGARVRTLSATGRIGGFTVAVKVLASASALSLSDLTFSPITETELHDGQTIKRIVGDPTFLSEASPGNWQGSVLLSVFVDHNGEESHFTTPAEVSVSIDSNYTMGSATIEIKSSAFTGASGKDPLQGLRVTDLSLS